MLFKGHRKISSMFFPSCALFSHGSESSACTWMRGRSGVHFSLKIFTFLVPYTIKTVTFLTDAPTDEVGFSSCSRGHILCNISKLWLYEKYLIILCLNFLISNMGNNNSTYLTWSLSPKQPCLSKKSRFFSRIYSHCPENIREFVL